MSPRPCVVALQSLPLRTSDMVMLVIVVIEVLDSSSSSLGVRIVSEKRPLVDVLLYINATVKDVWTITPFEMDSFSCVNDPVVSEIWL